MALKIAVLSQKGGTGKTTAVRHLADAFRRAGLNVLAVDLDPQGNLSDYFDVDPEATPTVGDVLSGRAEAAAADHDGIIPANLALAEAERVWTISEGSHRPDAQALDREHDGGRGGGQDDRGRHRHPEVLRAGVADQPVDDHRQGRLVVAG